MVKNLTDFLIRTFDKNVNRRALENMDMAGCFDSFPGLHRAMFFYMPQNDSVPFIERALRMVASYLERKNSAQIDLFGFGSDDSGSSTLNINLPQCEPWSKMRELEMEKEALGFYISSHPLEIYHLPLRFFANINVEGLVKALNEPEGNMERTVRLGGQITRADEYESKTGTKYGRFTIEDQTGSYNFALFKETYSKYKALLEVNNFVMLTGVLRPPFRKPDEAPNAIPDHLEVRFSEVRLLDAILENTSRTVYITLDIGLMLEEDLKAFVQIIKDHPGKQSYKLHVFDKKMNMGCNMSPVRGGINAGEVLPLLEKLPYAVFNLR